MSVNKQRIRLRKAGSKVRHCSVIDEEMSLPPLTRTRVRLSANATGAHSPIMMELKFDIEHRSFNEMLIGVFANQRMLLCLRSGWVPTSVLFLPIADKRWVCMPAATEVDITPIVCEQTYRASHLKCRRMYADVMLEREHHHISTESFDLFVFVRDLFTAMQIQTKLQYTPKK
jgi:hypothetical protein